MGYLLILIKSIANVGEGILIKKYNSKHTAGDMFFTGILSVFALLFFLITDKDGFNFPVGMLPYAIGYGLIFCVSYLLTFVAFANGSFTMSMLILSYALVLPIGYGIIRLHDPVTVFTSIGFALLIVSLFLVREDKKESEKKFSVKWLIAITITTIGNGLLAIIQKVQQVKFDNSCNNEFMIIGLGISAAILLIGGLIKDRKYLKEVFRYGIPYAACAGTSSGFNNFLTIYVNNLLPLSIVSPVFAVAKIIVSFFSSQLLFKEKYIKRQVIGVAVGAVALIFLNL